MTDPLLSVESLSVRFLGEQPKQAVDDISFQINSSEVMALVGESGSGKSVTAKTLTRLWMKSDPILMEGTVQFEKTNLLTCPEKQLQQIRGQKISYLFQEPSASFNPVLKIGHQLKEVFQRCGRKNDFNTEAKEQLQDLGIKTPDRVLQSYPHEMSGGMLQRIALFMALIPKPLLLIADEATTALDASTQYRIIELLKKLPSQQGTSLLFITHDLGLIKGFADTVGVMQKGKMVEMGAASEVLKNPSHPYSQRLLRSQPKIGSGLKRLPV